MFNIWLFSRKKKVQRKKQVNILKIFWWTSFKISYTEKRFLHVLAVLGYIPKLKRALRLAFGAHFIQSFYIKMNVNLNLYILIKFQYQTYFPSEDVKQCEFLNSCLDIWWRYKLSDLSSIIFSGNCWQGEKEDKEEIQKFEKPFWMK